MAGIYWHTLLHSKTIWIDIIKRFYTKNVVQELYKMLGRSFEIIGTPVLMVDSLRAGIKEFLSEPAMALMESPVEFAKKLAKGSVGMLQHTMHGAFNSAGRFTNSIGKGLALLTMDKNFNEIRLRMVSKRHRSMQASILHGLKHLTYGLVDGITGIVVAPVQGA